MTNVIIFITTEVTKLNSIVLRCSLVCVCVVCTCTYACVLCIRVCVVCVHVRVCCVYVCVCVCLCVCVYVCKLRDYIATCYGMCLFTCCGNNLCSYVSCALKYS